MPVLRQGGNIDPVMLNSPDPYVPGSRFGRFTIERELGTGGMGRVYRAHDSTLNRMVAVKVVRDLDAGASDRLLSEARSASGLNHPNICTIYEVGEVGGVPFIAMEFIAGQPLSTMVADANLSTDAVVRIGLQIAAALAHAHDRGVVHGDLKPQNVIVATDGSVKLVDFGLARTLDPISMESVTRVASEPISNEIAGTLPYMAPETLRGTRVRPAADTWALGVLLHEMAAGQRPFSGLTSVDLADAILNAPPAPLPASTAPPLAAVIGRCLAKEPAGRYRTARDVLVALEPLALSASAIRDRSSDRQRSRRAMTAVAALAAAGLIAAYFWLGRSAVPGNTRPSIGSVVVLPFDNLSKDSAEDYFADGMTDALITDLSRLPDLKVISRTSAARYKSLAKSSREIGRELGVEAIVDGSVLRANDLVRISVRLVDAATDRNLWAQDYTRKVGDVLALQADVARAIANEIRATFGPADEQRFAAAAAVDPRAFEEYLKGRHQWNRRTPESLLAAIEHFRRAVELQPTYGAAHAGIAESLVLLPAFPISAMSPEDALPQASASAARAIALDDGLVGAHAALGYARLHSLDPGRGESEFRRALTINPGHATTHFWYAAALASAGRFEESIAEARRAQTLDPVSPIIVSGVAWMHHLARNFDEEVRAARAALDLDPNFLMGHYRVGEGLLHQGRTAEAITALEKARALSDGSPDLIAAAAYACGRAGRVREAREALRTLLALKASKKRYVSPYALALVYTGLDDPDRAFEWLRRARAEHAWGMVFLDVEPDLDPLRKDPRFVEVAVSQAAPQPVPGRTAH